MTRLVLFVLFGIIVRVNAADKPPADKDQLQGRWKLIDADSGVPAKNGFAKPVMTVKDDTMAEHLDGEEIEKAKAFLLRPEKQPKQIDFKSDSKKNDLARVGIYKLEADTLTVCFSTVTPVREKFRPTDFTVTTTNGRVRLVYERIRNPREVVERFTAAALAGDVAAALARCMPGQPSEKSVKEFKDRVTAKEIAYPTVWADEKTGKAVAVSQEVTLTKANPDGQAVGRLVLNLTRADDLWRVKDIDFRTTEKADADVAKFKTKNAAAAEVKGKEKP